MKREKFDWGGVSSVKQARKLGRSDEKADNKKKSHLMIFIFFFLLFFALLVSFTSALFGGMWCICNFVYFSSLLINNNDLIT